MMPRSRRDGVHVGAPCALPSWLLRIPGKRKQPETAGSTAEPAAPGTPARKDQAARPRQHHKQKRPTTARQRPHPAHQSSSAPAADCSRACDLSSAPAMVVKSSHPAPAAQTAPDTPLAGTGTHAAPRSLRQPRQPISSMVRRLQPARGGIAKASNPKLSSDAGQEAVSRGRARGYPSVPAWEKCGHCRNCLHPHFKQACTTWREAWAAQHRQAMRPGA